MEGFDYIEQNLKLRSIQRSNREKVERGNVELEEGLKRLDRMPSAFTFIGKPNPNSPSLEVIKASRRPL